MSPNIFDGETAAQYQAACCTYIQQGQQAGERAMALVKDGGGGIPSCSHILQLLEVLLEEELAQPAAATKTDEVVDANLLSASNRPVGVVFVQRHITALALKHCIID